MTADDALERARELTDYARSFAELARAFADAAAAIDVDEVANNDRNFATRVLERELIHREGLVDLLALDTALITFVGTLAEKAGVSPQDILEQHFKAAPGAGAWARLKRKARDAL